MKKIISRAILASLALTACASSYQHEDISNVAQGDLEATISLQEITLCVGGITTASVIPYNDDNNPMIGVVESDDEKIVLVEGAHGNKWAFSGVNIGTTTVRFKADGQVVATVKATVNDQGNGSSCPGSG